MSGLDSLVKSDIFFFITSIAVVALTVVFVVILLYAVKILRDVKYISGRAKEETDKVVKDIGVFRSFAKSFLKFKKIKKSRKKK